MWTLINQIQSQTTATHSINSVQRLILNYVSKIACQNHFHPYLKAQTVYGKSVFLGIATCVLSQMSRKCSRYRNVLGIPTQCRRVAGTLIKGVFSISNKYDICELLLACFKKPREKMIKLVNIQSLMLHTSVKLVQHLFQMRWLRI